MTYGNNEKIQSKIVNLISKMKNSRIETEIEGKIISANELHKQAQIWAATVRNRAKINTLSFTKGKKGRYTYGSKEKKGKQLSKWHKHGEVEPKISQNLSFKIKEAAGVTEKIAFQFPRHGVFRAYGVGNGQPITGVTAKKSFIKRTPSDWMDEPINKNMEKLADIAAEFYGDQFCVKTHNAMLKS